MAKLAVNVDHVATLREARKSSYPDPVTAAMIAEIAGADGIVVHLREDRRHICERDVTILRDMVQTKLILEMAATDEMLSFALEVLPDLVTLVPEKREELTTEGGLDVIHHEAQIAAAVETLQSAGIPVSIFIDPDIPQIESAIRTKADCIELHTGTYCDAETPALKTAAFDALIAAAAFAKENGLGVNAGHGLCHQSIKAFKGVDTIDEYSIGHSIVSRAVMVGMEQSVREMVERVKEL